MNLSNEDVRDILRLIDQLELDEFELETDRFRLELRRSGSDGWTQSLRVLAAPREMPGPATRSEHAVPEVAGHAPDEPSATAEGTLELKGLLEIRAPLLGTFYRAPRPGAHPFVEVGDHVDEGTVVGIIETMKLMNSVHAGVRGTVVDIRKADTEFAERGDVLMLVEPDPS